MMWLQLSKRTLPIALLALVLLGGVAAPARAQGLRAERPSYSVGDKWIRSDGAYDLIRIENARYVFAADGGREVHLTRDLGLAKIVRGGQTLLEMEPPPSPTWPLEVGQWGVSWLTLKTLDPQYGQSLVRLSWRVEAYEDVRVPAGVFKAYRIVQVVEPRFLAASPQARRIELAFWYAPAAQQLVRADGGELGGLAFQTIALDRPGPTPLGVVLIDPKDKGHVTTDRITLTGRVTGGAGPLRIAVTVNGAEVAQQQEPGTPGKDVALSMAIKLVEGENSLIVTATDVSGAMRQQGRVLFYDKPAAAVAAAAPTSPAPAPGPAPAPARPAVTPPAAAAPPPAVSAPPTATPPPPPVASAPIPSPPPSSAPATPPPSAIASAPPSAPAPSAPAPPRAPVVAAPPAPAAPVIAAPAPPTPSAPTSAPATPEPPRQETRPQPEPARATPPTPPAPAAAPAVVASIPPVAPAPGFRIVISTPTNQARVDQETVTFAGLVHGGTGVRQVLVTANGVELWRQDNRSQQPAMAVNLPVKLVEGQNTLVVTAAEIDGTMHQEMRTVYLEKPVPLAVDVRYPEDRSRVTDEASVVAAVARSSKGISRIIVALNGAEVHRQDERSPQKSMAVSAPLTLRDGPNAIVITALEPDGVARQEIRTVILERPKAAAPVAAPAPPPPPPSTQWAVIIGVGGYESTAVPKLRYPVADADAVYQTLIVSGGFKKENILLLTDRTERKPTLRNIKWALGTFLARSAHKDDLVVIYFAGHGASEIDQRGVERDGLSKYLVPSDADPDDLYSTALPMDEMQNVLARIEAERITVFLDACYSGAAGGRTFASTKTRTVNVDDIFLERLTRSKGRAIVTASRPSELSVELPELGHGIFTYYLVRGLQGYADLNRDGIVSLQELYEYLTQEVSRKSRAVGGNQHPMMKGELEGALPLTKAGKRN